MSPEPMVRLSIGIAAVPERRREVQTLIASLPEDYRAHVHPCYDVNHRGSWYGHKLAWECFEEGATHHLAIEDDVALCANFIEVITAAISAVPDQVISPYASRASKEKVFWAAKQQSSWFTDAHGASGQAVLMPVPLLRDFLTWERRYCPTAMPYEDSRLWGWMYENQLLTWNTAVQLVEHTQPTNSILGFNNKGKVAANFLGNREGRDIDWIAGVAALQAHPKIFKYETGRETYAKWTGRYPQPERI